ncbi:MAG TPA: hypothetical protein P5133_15105 [Spirochaetia bacterium]|nr:hypothetical protein [Spirochaetia bacterium]HRZ66259.1 hypothetical protein [Spirochaetia bacterium]
MRNSSRARPGLLLAFAAALAALPAAAEAPAAGPVLAILEIENAGMDPRLDYLAGILEGILAFDLGSLPSISLADRRNLEAILKEKELGMSALGADPGAAADFGRIAGADWLLSGEYVFLGTEVLLSLSLTETASARRTSFRDRGSTENLVHRLAEQVAERLTGTRPSLADDSRARSLVSLRDESPGSIALHSPIIDAEVFLDGDFVGYTTGDVRKPFLIEKLRPGKHRVGTRLGNSFGVVLLPEIAFEPWSAEVEVEASKRLVLRDPTRHFNDALYRLERFWEGERKAPASRPEELALDTDILFLDRKGEPARVRARALPRPQADGALLVELSLELAREPGASVPAAELPGTRQAPLSGKELGSPYPWPSPARASGSVALPASADGEAEARIEAGILALEATLEFRYGSWKLELELLRTDLRQGMFAE